MNIIKVEDMDQELSFKIKTESYLYITAMKMLEFNRGDRTKLINYMNERIEKIEKISNVSKPLMVMENGQKILEVK
ncbi:MAG: hypothetical protein ACP5MU_04540 [Thermoplasmata archaeon]